MINSIFFFQNETSSRSASGANLKIMSLQGGGGRGGYPPRILTSLGKKNRKDG